MSDLKSLQYVEKMGIEYKRTGLKRVKDKLSGESIPYPFKRTIKRRYVDVLCAQIRSQHASFLSRPFAYYHNYV